MSLTAERVALADQAIQRNKRAFAQCCITWQTVPQWDAGDPGRTKVGTEVRYSFGANFDATKPFAMDATDVVTKTSPFAVTAAQAAATTPDAVLTAALARAPTWHGRWTRTCSRSSPSPPPGTPQRPGARLGTRTRSTNSTTLRHRHRRTSSPDPGRPTGTGGQRDPARSCLVASSPTSGSSTGSTTTTSRRTGPAAHRERRHAGPLVGTQRPAERCCHAEPDADAGPDL